MTQLRVVSGMQTSIIGLDYVAVIETAKIYDYELDSKRMDFIRVSERMIVRNHNKKSEE